MCDKCKGLNNKLPGNVKGAWFTPHIPGKSPMDRQYPFVDDNGFQRLTLFRFNVHFLISAN